METVIQFAPVFIFALTDEIISSQEFFLPVGSVHKVREGGAKSNRGSFPSGVCFRI